MILILLLFLAVYTAAFSGYLVQNPDYSQLDADTLETMEFRQMQLGDWILSEPPDYDRLTALMISANYDLRPLKGENKNTENWQEIRRDLLRTKPEEYEALKQAYTMILSDISCFPVPLSVNAETPDITYSDTFGEGRTYGGERIHEGCDLMGNAMPRGFYPVLSMTAGTVEQVGWLEKGGWRIGIRTPSGAYFYYAHLYRYSRSWQTGDTVQSGTLLGFMGDSGYWSEGTVGMFDVHLHLGIYIPTEHYHELSVNPYWILRFSESFRTRADF